MIKFGEFSTRRKLYRNPARRENLGTGSDRKKVVPESGTQRGNGDRQRSEESCTGIRYAERKRGQAAIGRKLYRNPVRQVSPRTGSDRKKVVPESGTSGRIREQTAIRRKLYRNPVRQVVREQAAIRRKLLPKSGTSGRIREQTAIRRKLYRNPVRQVGSGNRQRSEESCAEIRYVR